MPSGLITALVVFIRNLIQLFNSQISLSTELLNSYKQVSIPTEPNSG